MKIFNRITPNCAKCEWKRGKIDKSDMPILFCIAQGLKNCIAVYGNKDCRKLYKEIKSGLHVQMVGRAKRPKLKR